MGYNNMKYKVLNLNDVLDNNEKGCLSALRVLGECYKCHLYASNYSKPCSDRIENEEYNKLVKEKENATKVLDKIKRKMSEL